MTKPKFVVKGEFSIERDGKYLDYKVEYHTDGTIKRENGEAWLKLIPEQKEECVGTVVKIG